jgi:inosine-uridine nucleoside N-ribohydrolase
MTAILLDCDPGHDDALALLLALASPELELLGVTTVAGNQTLEKTTANAIRVLDFVGRDDVPVAAGAAAPLVRAPYVAAYVHGETGLDGYELPPPARPPLEQHAVDFLAGQIRARAGVVTLVPTGPLTNIAFLLALHPDIRPERIVLMGGAIAEGNVTPAAEFNIWADPEAAARVFASGIDVTMVGLDVTHKALFTPAHEQRLEGRVGELVRGLLQFYGDFHRREYGWDGSPIHDGVTIDTGSELGRGRTHVDVRRRAGWEPNAHVAVDIRADDFLDMLVERLNSFA